MQIVSNSAPNLIPVRAAGSRGALVALGLAAAGSAALWAFLAFGFRAGNGRDVAVFLVVIAALFGLAAGGGVAAHAVARHHLQGPQRAFGLVMGAALLFRLLLLPVGLAPSQGAAADDLFGRAVGFQRFLLYDHDVWRYLWDGHLVANGLDPYARTPEDWERLADAGDPRSQALLDASPWPDAFEMIAFRNYRTVYPPLAQAAFGLSAAAAPGSILVWKLLLLAVDLTTCGLLAALLARLGRARWEVLLYAWNPLVLKEIAGSGHVDALAACALTAAALALVASASERLGRLGGTGSRLGSFGHVLALASLALAGLAKVTPLAAAPAFLARISWRRWWALPVALAVGCWPFASNLGGFLAGLRAMGSEWRFNAGVWDLAVALGGRPLAFTVALAGPLAVGAWALRDRSDSGALRAAYLLLLCFLLSGPAVMPWYAVVLLPLAVVARGYAGLLFSALGFLSYLVYWDGFERVIPRLVEHGAVWALLVVELYRLRPSNPSG